MKVKIRVNDEDISFDSKDHAIMIVLSQKDKKIIGKMPEWATRYCYYPEEWTQEEADAFMEIGIGEKIFEGKDLISD